MKHNYFCSSLQNSVISNSYSQSLKQLNEGFEYISKIYNNNWYNVDYFINTPSIIANPILQISNSKKNTKALLAFKNYNSCINFQKVGDRYILQNSINKKEINWPEDETVYIIITETIPKVTLLQAKYMKLYLTKKKTIYR